MQADLIERRIEVQGHRCRYVDCGGVGEPVILLPSMLVIAPSYDTTARALRQNARVFIVELPGSGRSQRLWKAWDLDRYADWIAAWLDAVGLQRATLIGHSNSGAAALVTAQRHPDRVSRVVLNDTIGFDDTFSLTRVLLMRALDAAIEWRLTLTKGHHPFFNLFAHTRNVLYQVWLSAKLDLAPCAPAARCPALLAWGELDHTMPLRCMEKAKSLLPQPHVYLSRTGSHDWIVDHPEEFAAAVAQFLRDTRR